MKESELKSFLEGNLDARRLGQSVDRWDEDARLEPDLTAEHTLAPAELLRLLDAHVEGGLPLGALVRIAGGILGSDHFVWDESGDEGELVAAVVWDLSQPDDEAPLMSATVAIHRRALLR
jgi:hypothetical protein